jgi:hypothetical protein
LEGDHYIENMFKFIPEELPRLKRMSLSPVAVGQKTMERLCRLLTGGAAKARFISVGLVDGKRHQLQQVLKDKKGSVHMVDLTEGEFGKKTMHEAERDEFTTLPWA